MKKYGRFFSSAVMANREKPLRPRRLGQLPTSWDTFCAGSAREKAFSLCGEVTIAEKSEGLFSFAIIFFSPSIANHPELCYNKNTVVF